MHMDKQQGSGHHRTCQLIARQSWAVRYLITNNCVITNREAETLGAVQAVCLARSASLKGPLLKQDRDAGLICIYSSSVIPYEQQREKPVKAV